MRTRCRWLWVPACAGMTESDDQRHSGSPQGVRPLNFQGISPPAFAVAKRRGYFLLCLTQDELPADFKSDISVEKEDHRTIDHVNIAHAIGSCHLSGNISTW